MDAKAFLKQWRFTIILLVSVAGGAVTGLLWGPGASALKPFGDIFLNLLFTAVVPLVFFSLSSVIASASSLRRLGRIAGIMLIVFVLTGIISSVLMLGAVKVFHPGGPLTEAVAESAVSQDASLSELLVRTFTVPEFADLLHRRNILALIVFSVLTGLASQLAGERGAAFRAFLVSGAEVMGRLIRLIMLYAPVGLAAYFAHLAGTHGSGLLKTYTSALGVYYPVALAYFLAAFTLYAFIAGGTQGIGRFWTHIPAPALTAWGTGSSLAALPVNLEAARRIGVPDDVREIVLPIGAAIHMDGSCLAAILKIAVLFAMYGRAFEGPQVLLGAVGIALLCGVVMSGIPGGGFLGEMLIVTVYGFPAEALPMISMLGVLVDPPATMINASGDTVAAMLTSHFLRASS